MRIVLLNNYSDNNRHRSIWGKYIPEMISSWGYEVLLMSGECNMDLGYYSEAAYSSTDIFKQIMPYIQNGKLNDDDLIFFADARDYLAIPIMELLLVNNINAKVAGMWRNGIYYSFSDLRKRIDKDNIKKFKYLERSLTGMYDYNLITSEKHFGNFRNNYDSRRNRNNLYTCNYPYSEIISKVDNNISKEDLVIYNAGNADIMDRKAFEIIENEFPEYDFMVCNTQKFTKNEYEAVMKRAKVLFNTNRTESDPFIILESMMYGVIPIVPDFPIYDEMFPNISTYERKLLNPPYLKLIRNIEQITEPMKNYMTSHDKCRDEMVTSREYALNNFFNSNELKTFFDNVKNGNI